MKALILLKIRKYSTHLTQIAAVCRYNGSCGENIHFTPFLIHINNNTPQIMKRPHNIPRRYRHKFLHFHLIICASMFIWRPPILRSTRTTHQAHGNGLKATRRCLRNPYTSAMWILYKANGLLRPYRPSLSTERHYSYCSCNQWTQNTSNIHWTEISSRIMERFQKIYPELCEICITVFETF